MERQFEKIVAYWKSKYSSKIEHSGHYKIPEHFEWMAALMAPGRSFYYIANFHTLELEFITDSVEEFTGEKASEATLNKLLDLALPGEIEKIHRKEQVVQSFFHEYLRPNERLDYKLTYTYKNRTHDGKERIMLHQATVLSMNEEGHFIHVFSIHSDISHLSIKSTDDISFINLKGGPSYYNIDTSSGKFDPYELRQTENLKTLLSTRELEIIRELALGKSTQEIADKLHLSKHTINTHRKNILQKVDCNNSTHLVTVCLAEGLISI